MTKAKAKAKAENMKIRKREKRKKPLKIKQNRNIEDKSKDFLFGALLGFIAMNLAFILLILYHQNNIKNHLLAIAILGLLAGLSAKKSYCLRIGIGLGAGLPFLLFKPGDIIFLIFLFFTGSFLTGLLLSYPFHFFYSQLIKKLKSLSDFNKG